MSVKIVFIHLSYRVRRSVPSCNESINTLYAVLHDKFLDFGA